MTDLSNPEEFAKAFESLDATSEPVVISEPEAIRNALDADEPKHKPAKYPYRIVEGRMVKVCDKS